MSHETSPLSEREKDVARILLQGKSNKQIALELGISNRTVEFHLRNIYTKLGVASRAEAILKLTETDLWKTTGALRVESTVDKTDDPAENDANVISWRIPMQKTFYIVGGILLTILIVTLIVLDITPNNREASPTPVVPTPTVHVEVPTTTMSVPTQTTEPVIEGEQVIIPPHTVNGYTATIESYYVDISHVIFQVRVTGHEFDASQLGYTDLYDEYGNLINASGGIGPSMDMDPSLLQLNFEPTTLLKGDRFKGQLTFNIYAGEPNYETLAKFSFDFDLPIYPEVRFSPKQTVSANGIDILVDSVTVTPVFTQVYLCYEPPSSDAPWRVGNGTVIEIAGHEVPIYNVNGLFSSYTGSYWGTRSEPYWAPPVKNGVCDKIGFQTGTGDSTSLKLTIPDLENMLPFLQSPIDLDALYPGLGKRQAYHTYLEENGFTHKGPWVFNIELAP